MSDSVSIPIAGFKDVYDLPRVEKALHDLPPFANSAVTVLTLEGLASVTNSASLWYSTLVAVGTASTRNPM